MLHRYGLVHRDLKPGNVFVALSPEGVPSARIGDFGLTCQLPEAKAALPPDAPQPITSARCTDAENECTAELNTLDPLCDVRSFTTEPNVARKSRSSIDS